MSEQKKLPKTGEILTATITNIGTNSAFAKLEGYDKEGLIHISEVAKGWVKDIRKHVKKGQKVAVKVTRVDPYKGYISLSIKAVAESQKSDAFREKHLQKRAEKMLEMLAKDIKRTTSQIEKELESSMDTIGSLYKVFEKSNKKPEKLEKLGVSDSLIKSIQKIAEKNIKQKQYIFKADLEVTSLKQDGVKQIQKTLKEVEKKKVKVSYISAPKYSAQYKSKNAKRAQKAFETILTDTEKQAKKDGVNFSFKIEE
ncbi:hypothetical protein CL614_04415 [archaeon]|nr:hypothetical protein [archaeon]|tara:strand:+ start:2551 stop:3315 length:765 start_codon:yes stop_codon:yes gene_type:complete